MKAAPKRTSAGIVDSSTVIPSPRREVVAGMVRHTEEVWRRVRNCSFAATILHAAAYGKEAESARLELEALAGDDPGGDQYNEQLLSAARRLCLKEREFRDGTARVRARLRGVVDEWQRQSEVAAHGGKMKEAKYCRVQARKAATLETDIVTVCGVIPALPEFPE